MFKVLPFLALASSVFAQSQDLNATLSSNNQTSALAGLIGGFPELLRGLASARNITILAPSNDAISALLNSTLGKSLANDTGLTQAVLQYHVLNGTYHASDVTNTSTFIPTLLTNTSYTNVTGGQVVNAIRTGDNVTFFSGLNMNSTVVQAVSVPKPHSAGHGPNSLCSGCELHWRRDPHH
jgi:uncharacterized surface protein with fasciclin (FAS1) repeats